MASIRKRERKGKDVWVCDYKDQHGKRRLKTFAKKKDAEAFETNMKVEVGRGMHTPDSQSPTVREAATAWLAVCATGDEEHAPLERATLAQYRQHVNLHIVPFLGDMKLSRLTKPGIKDFRLKLLRGDPAQGETEGQKRSPQLVKKIVTSLGSLIGEAQDSGRFAGTNPARRSRHGTTETRHKRRLEVGTDIPTLEEISRLLAAAEPFAAPLLHVAVFTGLRASELRGLRWADVDLKHGALHVRQRADRYLQIGPPKSNAGTRTIALPPGVLKALKEWKLACPKAELGLVFPTSTGRVQHHKNIVRDVLNPALARAGLGRKYGLHPLRHFFASWLINRKEDGGRELPPKMVQMLMGHSSITMTMDTYGHLFPTRKDATLAEAEQAILLATKCDR